MFSILATGTGDEIGPTLPANLLRQKLTDQASIDSLSLSVFPETDLMEQLVDPPNPDREWRRVKANRGALGPDGMTIKAFESWCPEHWPAVKQQLLDGTYAMPNKWLEQLGLLSLKQLWCDLAPLRGAA